MASKKRDHLIDTALRLFQQEGYHATGIDRVIEEAGVARMTLYNHFKSKDELILAVLHRQDEVFRNSFMRKVEKSANTPRDRILAVFDALGDWFASDDFNGCMFIHAAGEFSSPENPIHRTVKEHKTLFQTYLRNLAGETGVADPIALGDSLNLLAEGAIVMAHAASDPGAAAQGRKAADDLLRQAGL